MDREDELAAAAHYAEGGPVHAASVWLEFMLAGDVDSAWPRTHPTFRLCLVQDALLAWFGEPQDDFARLLASEQPFGELNWKPVSAGILAQFQADWPDLDLTRWGASSRERIIAPGLEIVLFVDTFGLQEAGGKLLDNQTILVDQPTRVRDHLFVLMAHEAGDWLVARLGTGPEPPDRLPEPGWPPIL